ncbi:MAG: magnesium transporter [Alphaproteobacteria bacterium]
MAGPGNVAPETAAEANAHEEGSDLYGLTPEMVRAIRDALDREDTAQVEALIVPLHAADKADLLEMVDAEERRVIVDLLCPDFDPDILAELEETVRDEVIAQLDTAEIAAAVSELDTDDAVYLLEDLSEQEKREILDAIPPEDRIAVEEGLAFPENSAGRLMQRELVAVPAYWTIGQTIDFLRSSDDLPDEFYDIFVVDPRHAPIGYVPLSRIMRTRRPVLMNDIMEPELRTIPAEMDQEEVAYLFHQYGLVSAPVVDASGRLIGVITVDDVVEVIDEEAEEDIMRLGGVSETDLHEPAWRTTRRRFTWLFVNMGTAILASLVIGLFDATIERMVALAVLMPIVASMGGNAGTQTLTVTVRALATKDLTPANALRHVGKEAAVGILNGALFALIAGVVAAAWFGDATLGAVIAAAMIINMIVAALAGILVPLGLDRFGVDPAIAATVFVTTVTDVVGFFAFLGLAALLLL